MKKNKEYHIFKDPFDGEYVGNIWGWKYSFIGLGIILFFLSIMIYRHYTLDVGFGGQGEPEKIELKDKE